MKTSRLLFCFWGFLLLAGTVMAECPDGYWPVLMPGDPWCCPNVKSCFACTLALGNFEGRKACYFLNCFPDHLKKIKEEREAKKKRNRSLPIVKNARNT